MSTTNRTFRHRFRELTAQIDALPEHERAPVRALAAETLRRHRANRRNVDAARAAARELDVLERLRDLQLASLSRQLDAWTGSAR